MSDPDSGLRVLDGEKSDIRQFALPAIVDMHGDEVVPTSRESQRAPQSGEFLFRRLEGANDTLT